MGEREGSFGSMCVVDDEAERRASEISSLYRERDKSRQRWKMRGRSFAKASSRRCKVKVRRSKLIPNVDSFEFCQRLPWV